MASTDRNLLLGILALQLDFVTRDQLIAAMHAWVSNKSKPLEELLVEQGALGGETRTLLTALVARHLELHANDPQQSLAAVSSLGSLREDLRSLADPDLEASLSMAASGRDADATLSWHLTTPRTPQRFRVLRPHARGGLGQVSVAMDNELHREVALKEILTDRAHDPDSRSRFVLEAEITGGLEHPGIVPVYGLGQYADGRPFYAMRFIRGDSLREAVDAFYRDYAGDQRGEKAGARGEGTALGGPPSGAFQSVAFRQLLGRFVDVCNALDYAHSRGVLHRDLKPGNIMLGRYGETLVVDWGLAKVQGRATPEGEEATLRPASASGSAPTLAGTAVGTPAFMSPEQAGGRLDELGATSDVYSLGATLYYVLTRRPPFLSDDVATTLRMVQAGEFPTPQTINPAAPRALTAICLKAMARRPADRYASPRLLADDVERYLADEPVGAQVEPWSQQARRWLRKHPRTVAALAASLLVGLSATVVIAAVVAGKNQQLAAANEGLRSANQLERRAKDDALRQRMEAEQARLQEQQAKEQAQRRLTQVEKGAEILGAVFAELDPRAEEIQGRPLRAILGERLEQAVADLEGESVGDPLVVARLQHILGKAQRQLGFTRQAVVLHEKARQTRERLLGTNAPETLITGSELGKSYLSNGDLQAGLPLLESTAARMRETLEENDPDLLVALDNLALAYNLATQPAKAMALHEEVLARRRALSGEKHADTLNALNNLAADYYSAGRIRDALPMFETALAASRELQGVTHPDTLVSMNNLGAIYLADGQEAKGLKLLEESLDATRDKLGESNPHFAQAVQTLGIAYFQRGQINRGLPLLERAAELKRKILGADHPDTLDAVSTLATAYYQQGQHGKALPLLEEAYQGLRSRFGDESTQAATAAEHLAEVYGINGQAAKAIPLLERLVERHRKQHGPDHMATLAGQNSLGTAYIEAGEYAKAVTPLESVLGSLRGRVGDDDPRTIATMYNLAGAYLNSGQAEKALPLLTQTLAARQTHLGKDHADSLETMRALAVVHEHLRQPDRAEAVLRESLALHRGRDPERWQTHETACHLGVVLADLRKHEEAESLLVDGLENLEQRESQIPVGSRRWIDDHLQVLIKLYEATDRSEAATKWKAKLAARKNAEKPADAR
jgi:serine/threonine protein kinase